MSRNPLLHTVYMKYVVSLHAEGEYTETIPPSDPNSKPEHKSETLRHFLWKFGNLRSSDTEIRRYCKR